MTCVDNLRRCMTFYEGLCQWKNETEIVIKYRKNILIWESSLGEIQTGRQKGTATHLSLIVVNCHKMLYDTQRALRDILMPRGKNCLPTVSRQFLTLNCPRPNCLGKCLPNCLSPTLEDIFSSFKIAPVVRVIARQLSGKNCLAAIFASRHQDASPGPLGILWQLWRFMSSMEQKDGHCHKCHDVCRKLSWHVFCRPLPAVPFWFSPTYVQSSIYAEHSDQSRACCRTQKMITMQPKRRKMWNIQTITLEQKDKTENRKGWLC